MDNESLKLSVYNFDVPPELVAQEPLAEREMSRLMVLSRQNPAIRHRCFADLVEFLNPGDCLVVNRTKVIPARVFGKKETGGKVEILFLNTEERSGGFPVLLKPAMSAGKKIIVPGGTVFTVNNKTPRGEYIICANGANVNDIIDRYGSMPLPPYIKRPQAGDERDKSRYQTVYAAENGSIAAPTAGLHFTDELLCKIREKGVSVAEVILHVGWGTFRLVAAENISAHKMLPEYFKIPDDSLKKINLSKKNGCRVVAVGTTSVRALESSAGDNGAISVLSGETSLFIYPGYRFRLVDAMITNFHLPKSTPLLMACAFAGTENIFGAYREAVKQRYRLFSYGDAMLIL